MSAPIMEGIVMETSGSSTTRRLLIGSSIATLGGAVSLATAGPAAAADGGLSSTGEPAAAAPDAPASLPVLAVGEQTLYFGPLGWAAYANAAGATVVVGTGGSRPSSGWLGRSIDLPPGSTINGLDLTLGGTGSISATCWLMKAQPDVSATWSAVATVSGSAVGTTVTATSQVVTTGTTYSVELLLGSTTTVTGLRVRYTPPAPSGLNLVAITPARVYDSRFSMAPDASGAMGPGTNRTISVANRRNPATGAVNLANVVPSTAKAIAYTLTATGTTGSGYLAVNPGGDTVVHASTINWAAGQTLANSGVIAVSPTRTITLVRGGGGSAQFIVDVIGYYVQ
jgi:hypothetical protein